MSPRPRPKSKTPPVTTRAKPQKSKRPTLRTAKRSPPQPETQPAHPITTLSDGSSVADERRVEMEGDMAPAIEPDAVDARIVEEALPRIEVQPMFEPAPELAQPGLATLGSAPVYYTKDEFAVFFGGMFHFAGLGASVIPPLHRPMQTLVTAQALPSFRPAADAIYDLAQKHEWLRWLIDKASDDLKAFMFIGLFALGVGIGVKEELQQRRALVAKLEEEYERAESDENDPNKRKAN